MRQGGCFTPGVKIAIPLGHVSFVSPANVPHAFQLVGDRDCFITEVYLSSILIIRQALVRCPN